MNPEPDETGRPALSNVVEIVVDRKPGIGANSDASAALNASLAAVAERNRVAFESLYAATVDRVLNLATRIMGDADAADDVASDVYLQVWRKASDFDPQRGSAIAWIMTICRSRALDQLRRRSVAAGYMAKFEQEPAANDEEHGPQDLLAATDRQSAVHAALRKLDASERQLLALVYFRGYTHRELAAFTGQPLGTVKTRIRRTLIKVRGLMNDTSRSTGESP